MSTQNFAVKLCGILQSQSDAEIIAREWRLVGQEQDGSQLLTWITSDDTSSEIMKIGLYTNKTKSLKVLHTFVEKSNIIQASINATHTLLIYVVKTLQKVEDEITEALYTPFIVPLLQDKENKAEQVENGSTKQIMVQFLYGKSYKFKMGAIDDRFLVLKHLDCIKLYRTTLLGNDGTEQTEGLGPDEWRFMGCLSDPEVIVKVFSWAQWDCINQVLYYIHHRQPTQSFAEGEEVKSPSEVTPTLSALQFHADLPHETVLNIPLSLPQLVSSGAACGVYEDDPLPLRIHDCSLDLHIVCEPEGMVCVCHHYLYKPLDDSTSSLVLEDSTELKDSGVNFAYSITLLHHGLVVHNVVPDLPWALAKSLRPSYTFYGDNHLLVNIPMLFTHLLDIGVNHEPCNHFVMNTEDSERGSSLAPLLGWGPNAMVDLNTLDIVILGVPEKDLVSTFKNIPLIENKLGIIHFLLQHEGNSELAEELISWMCLNQKEGCGSFQRVMQEFLISATFAFTRRSLPTSALSLTKLLPFTQNSKFADVKVGNMTVCVSQEKVWNSSVVVLSPRARLAQFTEDLWTRLWIRLNPPYEKPPRFRPQLVLDKLRVSLTCYQPEALSRCSTPLSPSGSAPMLGAGISSRRTSLAHPDMLPFFELDVCTASKQEHVIAANLREVSVHLMRECAERREGAESGVHAVGTRWAAAQLDSSRALCRALCRALLATPLNNQQRGFTFIDDMEETHAMILFSVLEQYYLAADSLAFPLPQGFTSFFTYLGYKVLPFSMFLQYVHRNVFELQIDVMKAIIAVKDTSKSVSNKKLRLIQLVGEGRARRSLCAWHHGASVRVRAREHAAALLAGAPAARASHSTHLQAGLSSLATGERLSPLDSFLDLLTAKASLNELDFNLIIEATLSSLHNNSN